MTLILLQTFKAADGCYDELAKTVATMLVDTAAHKGALLVRAAGNAATDTVTLLQEWDGPENQQAYVSWRMATDMTKFLSLLKEPPASEELSHIF